MSQFRISYRHGSFARLEDCASYEQAVERALSLHTQRGVSYIRVHDKAQRTLLNAFDLSSWRSKMSSRKLGFA